MPFQDASNMTIAWASEGTYGTLPGTQYAQFRITGESLEPAVNTERSNEIVSGRQNKETLELGRQVVGGFQTEMSYTDMIGFLLPRGMQTLSSTTIDEDTAISVDASAKTYTRDASVWATTPTVGGMYYFSGFSAGNNGWKRVTAATTTVITVADPDTAMVTTEPAIDGDIDGATILTGTSTAADSSFSLEKVYLDPTTDVYIHHSGCVFDSWSVNFTANSIPTAEFEVRGKTTTEDAATDSSPASSAVNTLPILTSKDIKVYLNGQGTENVEIESFTISMNHNLRERFRLGAVNLVDYGFGTLDVSGTMRAYFSSNDTLTDFMAFTTNEITVVTEDSAGRSIAFNFPAAKFTKHAQPSPARSTDVFADIEFDAQQSSELQQVSISFSAFSP